VIDAAKAVGATARSTFSSWLLTEWGRHAGAPVETAPPNVLPVIAIPTMAAAGSEANGAGVLINREDGTKAVFFVSKS
jgi:alcohol dehydrogenase class IV